MPTIVNSYISENKMVSTPAGELRLLSECISDGKVSMQAFSKVVDTREEALALRKALKETGWDKLASFSKQKIFVGFSAITGNFEYETKYVISAIHHFN